MRIAAILVLASVIVTAPVGAQPKEKPKWPPSPHIAATEPLPPAEQLKKMKVPPGFEIQLVAADPDIRKPINIAFDAAGRLWVTESIEYPFPAKEGEGRDTVKVLEDFGPDGRARKITTFADKLNIPIGVLPDTDGKGALVYSIPSIFHLRDNDGDGKADKREVYYTGFGHKDTHGMTGEFLRGFDGWIYACHGFANTSNVKSKDGSTSIAMTSGNTYRIKPDGSRIEMYTRGQVNPFGIAIDPLGNLYTADCHSRPLTMLLRGALYEHFGNKHDGLGFAPHLNTFNGHSTALCGIAYYAADQFPKQYHEKLFLGDVVLNRVNAYKLQWTGKPQSPPAFNPKEKIAVMEDFITSQDPWFRPVDIKLGPDGCLYIADFYTRIIGHYEVPLVHPGRDNTKGRIWRVVWRGAKQETPRPVVDLTKADVPTLVDTLANPNLTVRLQAADQLVERGGNDAVGRLQKILEPFYESGDSERKAHALWILERMGKLDDKTLEIAITRPTKNAHVRLHALRILAEKKNWSPEYTRMIVKGVFSDVRSAQLTRIAIEALATHPHPDHVEALLSIGGSYFNSTDPHAKYAWRHALREQMRDKATWENFDASKLGYGSQFQLAEICKALPQEPAATFLRGFIERNNNTSPELIRHAVRYGKEDATEWAIRYADKRYEFKPNWEPPELPELAVILKAIVQAQQERGGKWTETERAALVAAVQRMFDSKLKRPNNNDMHATCAELAGMLKMGGAMPKLLEMASSTNTSLCKASVTAAVAIDPKEATKRLAATLSHPPFRTSEATKETIISTLASLDAPEAHQLLLDALQGAPARVQTSIALGMSGSALGGDRLLKAIEAGKASPRLLQDRAIELRLASAKVANVKMRLVNLTKGLPPADQKAQELIAKKRDAFISFKADAVLGEKIFQKNCAACHQVAGQGAKIGPQLDGIGVRGLERILEDVLDPNRNVDQAFRTTIVSTKMGQTLSGLFLREEGNVIILADQQGKDVRVEKAAIDERRISPLSPMPANFAETIGEADFHHLVAFLLNQRGKQ